MANRLTNWFEKFLIWLLNLNYGIDKEAEDLYEKIWPKHDPYKKQTMSAIKESLRRMKLSKY